MKSIIRRLSIIEKNVGTHVIPEKERIIVIPYPANHEEEFRRLAKERIEMMKEKYGQNLSDNDLLIRNVRVAFDRADPCTRTCDIKCRVKHNEILALTGNRI